MENVSDRNKLKEEAGRRIEAEEGDPNGPLSFFFFFSVVSSILVLNPGYIPILCLVGQPGILTALTLPLA